MVRDVWGRVRTDLAVAGRYCGMDGMATANQSVVLDEFMRDVFGYSIYEGKQRWTLVYLRGLMLPWSRPGSLHQFDLYSP